MNNSSKIKAIKEIVSEATQIIAPFWPLKNLIACNPLQGLEKHSFDQALLLSKKYFQRDDLPESLIEINRQSIKWCEIFFDEGIATISIMDKKNGLYRNFLKLAIDDYDLQKSSNHRDKNQFLNLISQFPQDVSDSIEFCLEGLKVDENNQKKLIEIILTSLSGFSSYLKYLDDYQQSIDQEKNLDNLIALRLALMVIYQVDVDDVINWFNDFDEKKEAENIAKFIKNIEENENKFISPILQQIIKNKNSLNKNDEKNSAKKAEAQFIFCIDVRSEKIRRAIEKINNYQTFGYAGFFGVFAKIKDEIKESDYSSCPVLFKPKFEVKRCSDLLVKEDFEQRKSVRKSILKFYNSLKYNFATAIALAELSGFYFAILTFLRTSAKKTYQNVKNFIFLSNLSDNCDSLDLSNISLEEQLSIAKSTLNNISLNKNFAEIIFLCAHGSKTENNAFASSLDCGACGGNSGEVNAKIVAEILNKSEIRNLLQEHQIKIPEDTIFIAAKHITTNDEIIIYPNNKFNPKISEKIAKIKIDLEVAKRLANRETKFDSDEIIDKIEENLLTKTIDWSETRPEWGLAKNACFIVGDRELTKNIDLAARSFLHSYNFEEDKDLSILNLIINAPMVVASWINGQYFFSTYDNISFGAGSKITQNITGKIGVMQGNSSDLMTGLPLQSVNFSDTEKFHEMLRLSVIIDAPSEAVLEIVKKSDKIKELCEGGWIKLFALNYDQSNKEKTNIYQLLKDLSWQRSF
jgi:hypothetical protein